MGADRGIGNDVHVLACQECPRVCTAFGRGWKAYRIDDPLEEEPPALAFYCPECSRQEFGGWSRKVEGS